MEKIQIQSEGKIKGCTKFFSQGYINRDAKFFSKGYINRSRILIYISLSILKANPVWQQYEQQKHDLFLPDRPNNPALTAAPGVAGYLTSSSMRQTVPNVPPPMTDMANNGNDSLI